LETLDPATEWMRLSERYRQMSDDEVVALGRQIFGTTEVAQQVLTHEISQRKLTSQLEQPPAPLIPEPPPDGANAPDLYSEERHWSRSAPCGACPMRFSCRTRWTRREYRFIWARRRLRGSTRGH